MALVPSTLTRSIVGELASSTFAALMALTGVLLVGQIVSFTRIGLDPGVLSEFIGFFLVQNLPYTLPCSLLLGVLLTFGRIMATHEFVAIRCAGYSPWILIRAVVLPGLLCSLAVFALKERVIPAGARALAHRAVEVGGNFSRFRTRLQDPILAVPGHVLYATSRTEDTLNGFVMHDLSKGEIARVIVAEKALVRRFGSGGGSVALDLNNVRVFGFSAGAPTEAILPAHQAILGASNVRATTLIPVLDTLSLQELAEQARTAGENPRRAWFAFCERLALCISPLAFVLAALPLSVLVRTGGHLPGIFVGLLLTVGAYYPLALVGKIFAIDGILPVAVGAFLPAFLFLGLGLALLRPALWGLR